MTKMGRLEIMNHLHNDIDTDGHKFTPINTDKHEEKRHQGKDQVDADDNENEDVAVPNLECYFRTGQNQADDGDEKFDDDDNHKNFETTTSLQGHAILAQEEGKKSSFLLTAGNYENGLLHSIACPSHLVIEYKPSLSSTQTAVDTSGTTTAFPFFLGGVQLVSSAKDAVVYLTGLDGKEMYLMTSKGIKFRGELPTAVTDYDPSTKNREWFKSICVIPGGPRPILRLRISLRTVRPKDSQFADVLSMKLTARLTEQLQTQTQPSALVPGPALGLMTPAVGGPSVGAAMAMTKMTTSHANDPSSSAGRPSSQYASYIHTRRVASSELPSGSKLVTSSSSSSHLVTAASVDAALESVSGSTSTATSPPSVSQLQPHLHPHENRDPPLTQSDLSAAMAGFSFMSRTMEKTVCERLEKHTESCISRVEGEMLTLKSIVMAQQQQLVETQKLIRQQQILLDRQSNQIRDLRLHQEDVRVCVQAVQADMSAVRWQHESKIASLQPKLSTEPCNDDDDDDDDDEYNGEENAKTDQSIFSTGSNDDIDVVKNSKSQMKSQVCDDGKKTSTKRTLTGEKLNTSNNDGGENGRKNEEDDELEQILDCLNSYHEDARSEADGDQEEGRANTVATDNVKKVIHIHDFDSNDDDEDEGDDDDEDGNGDGNDTAFMSVMSESVFLNVLDKKPDPPLPSDPIVRFPPTTLPVRRHDGIYTHLSHEELHHQDEVPPPLDAQLGDVFHAEDETTPTGYLRKMNDKDIGGDILGKEENIDEDIEIHQNIEVTLWEDDLASKKAQSIGYLDDSIYPSDGSSEDSQSTGSNQDGVDDRHHDGRGIRSHDKRTVDNASNPKRPLDPIPMHEDFSKEKKEEYDPADLEKVIAQTRADMVDGDAIAPSGPEDIATHLKTNLDAQMAGFALPSHCLCTPTNDKFV